MHHNLKNMIQKFPDIFNNFPVMTGFLKNMFQKFPEIINYFLVKMDFFEVRHKN